MVLDTLCMCMVAKAYVDRDDFDTDGSLTVAYDKHRADLQLIEFKSFTGERAQRQLTSPMMIYGLVVLAIVSFRRPNGVLWISFVIRIDATISVV